MNLQNRLLHPPTYEQKPMLIPEGLRYSQQPSAEKQPNKNYTRPKENDSDNQAKQSQSNTKNLKTLCYYHPNQVITNFCSNPECLMPLCPVCIDIHQREHNAKQELSTFEPIDFVQQKSLSELLNLIEQTKNISSVLQQVQEKYQAQNSNLKEKINFFKMQIIQIVEQFFEQFTKQILDDSYQSEKSFANSAKFVQQQLESIMNELMQSKEEILTPEKMLKVIIQLYSTNYYNQTKDYLSRKQTELMIAQDSMIEANLDEMKINEIPILLNEIVQELAPVQQEPEVQQVTNRLQQEIPVKEVSPKSEIPSKSIAFQQSDIQSSQLSNKQNVGEQSPQLPQFAQKNQQLIEKYSNKGGVENQNKKKPLKQSSFPQQQHFNQQALAQQQAFIQQQMIAQQQQQILAQEQMLKQQYYEQGEKQIMPPSPQEFSLQQQQNYYSQRYQHQPLESKQKQLIKSPQYYKEANYAMTHQQPKMKYSQEMVPRQNQQWGMGIHDPKRSFGPYQQYNNKQYF